MLNNVTLIGRMTRDPELRYTSNGNAVTNFSLAVNRRYNREVVDFIDCVCWKGLAENVANYTVKGSLIAVQGSIQVRTYEAQDGQKRKVPEVVCDDVRFLDKKKDSAPKEPDTLGWDDLGTEVDAPF